MNFRSLEQRHPKTLSWIVALVTLIASGALTIAWMSKERDSLIREQRLLASTLAANHARIIEANLRHSLSAAYTLATYVRNVRNVGERFQTVTEDMLQHYPDVQSLSLSPGGIIRYVSPLEDNRAALGFNQLADPEQGRESRLTLEDNELRVAGPLRLVQGMDGIVARYPVTVNGAFWGFANVTLRLDRLLEVARLDELERQGYHYELKRLEPPPGEPANISGNAPQPLNQPVEQRIEVPNNPWVLSIAPARGWLQGSWYFMAWGTVLLLPLLLGYLAKVLLELRWHKRHLEREVSC